MSERPNQDRNAQPDAQPPFPADGLIILPVRLTVLFPGMMLPLAIGRPASVAAAQEAVRSERPLGVIMQADPAVGDPDAEQLHRVGTVGQILRYITAPDGTHHVICRGLRRFRVLEYVKGFPYLVARVEEIGNVEVMGPEIEARIGLLRERAREAIALLPNAPPELASAIENLDSASALADFIAGVIDIPPDEKQRLLETFDVKERLDKVLAMIAQRVEVLKISRTIGEQTQQKLSSQQREHILREQLRQIQQELGEGDEKAAEIAELRAAIEKAGMPK
jgi:ATP-dependent Lon protease